MLDYSNVFEFSAAILEKGLLVPDGSVISPSMPNEKGVVDREPPHISVNKS